jgi:hypothetical protein
MTMARAQLVDVSLARWYHCVTRCAVAARSRRRRGVVGRGSCPMLGAALPTAIRRSSSDWITSTLKMRLFDWQRRRRAALPDRVLRSAWKILCGFVRSKTAADWIRPAKACCKASRWGVTSNSSITLGDSFARARLRSRRSWPGDSRGSAAVSKAGRAGWRSSATVGCLAVSLRPLGPSCGRLPSASECGGR